MPGLEGAPAAPIRVLVVEDHRMFAEALSAMLASQPGIEVVGGAGTVAASVTAARRLRPTVVLMDYRLPDGEGSAAARAIRDENPQVRVLLVTANAEESLLREALRSGCSGIVTKGRSMGELVRAVRSAANGETVISSRALDRVVHPPGHETPLLSGRQIEILRLTGEGLDPAEIAARLGISVVTVRNHLQGCIRRLGVHSKTQAVSLAIRRGIIPAPG
ncbi:MAG TPA: response regulator transcription factor [Candidatus Angelobacter sp.]|nr:response regulator transcription factor [Candidatus Angelobacter sp.]